MIHCLRTLALPALVLAPALFLAAPQPAEAHGPTPKRLKESVTIAAAPDAVWATIGSFCGIADWHPMVTACEGPETHAIGDLRRLTLVEGGDIVDGLDEYNADAHSYAYRLSEVNPEAIAVSFYTAELMVEPAEDGSGSMVTWKGVFYRADTGNYPSESTNDEAAIESMTTYFRSGLDGLKATVEGTVTQ